MVLSTGTVMTTAQKLYGHCGYNEVRRQIFAFPEYGLTEADDVGMVVFSRCVAEAARETAAGATF